MPTNDERREVAARLREQKPWSVFTDFQDCIGDLCDAVFDDEGDLNDMFRLQKVLADLIEPEPERTCHKNPPDALVVYKGDEVIGTFDTYEQAAEFLGVKVSSVKFMGSPSYQRRKGSKRPTGRTRVERVYFEEGEEW